MFLCIKLYFFRYKPAFLQAHLGCAVLMQLEDPGQDIRYIFL